ncbi:hypothetical protein Vadar_008916 [Vaccinium darrowii]|uniref:Uncharacterized protein n=1 Tax=Vaccinium darrowii TaxID=229202 RepID=A0ACB7XGZ1_9ERIC|nr:hypothetical protein Vadar_008916 [Vaccinium darrowii]
MSNPLFDLYQNKATAKEVWAALEANSMNSSILDQFTQQNMKMDESIAVSTVMDKLSSTWKDYKKSLKHKKEDLSLEEWGNHLALRRNSGRETILKSMTLNPPRSI